MSETPNQPPPSNGWQQVHNPPPPGYQPGYNPGQPPPPYAQPSQPMAPNVASTVAYLTFIGAICMLVIDPYRRSPLVRFHAWQCLVLSGASILGDIAFAFVGSTGMWSLAHALHHLFDLVLFIGWLIAIIKAYQGEWYKLPIVGDLAENFARSVPS